MAVKANAACVILMFAACRKSRAFTIKVCLLRTEILNSTVTSIGYWKHDSMAYTTNVIVILFTLYIFVSNGYPTTSRRSAH